MKGVSQSLTTDQISPWGKNPQNIKLASKLPSF